MKQHLPIFLITTLLVWFSIPGCGYEVERPGLPGGASSISLGIIQNKTQQGGIDVKLKTFLRQAISSQSGFDVRDQQSSDTILEVTINSFNASRAIDITNTNISNLTYHLTGAMRLVDNRYSKEVLIDTSFNVVSTVIFSDFALETPAIRQSAMETLLQKVADQILQQINQHF